MIDWPSMRSAPGADAGQNEPRLFFAQRHDSFYVRYAVMMALLLSPLVFFAPAYFVAGLLGVAVSGLINRHVFAFELTRSAIVWKPGFFAPTLRIPYAELEGASVRPEPFLDLTPGVPPCGVVMLALRGGGDFAVPGVIDPDETVEAIQKLKAAA